MRRIQFFSLFLALSLTFPLAAQRSREGKKQTGSESDFSFSEEGFKALQWRNIGPFRGGRAVAVAGVPGNSQAYYFGSVGGRPPTLD